MNIPLSLQLDDSAGFTDDSLQGFDTTFRALNQYGENVSVAVDRVRFDGMTVGDAGLRSQLRLGRKLGIAASM